MAYLDKANVGGQEYDLGKPIYYHGITFDDSTWENASVTFAVLNNSNTAFTQTSLTAWISDVIANYGALVIAMDGNLYNYPDVNSVQKTGVITTMVVNSTSWHDNTHGIILVATDLSTGKKMDITSTIEDFFTYFSHYSDRFNQIN